MKSTFNSGRSDHLIGRFCHIDQFLEKMFASVPGRRELRQPMSGDSRIKR